MYEKQLAGTVDAEVVSGSNVFPSRDAWGSELYFIEVCNVSRSRSTIGIGRMSWRCARTGRFFDEQLLLLTLWRKTRMAREFGSTHMHALAYSPVPAIAPQRMYPARCVFKWCGLRFSNLSCRGYADLSALPTTTV